MNNFTAAIYATLVIDRESAETPRFGDYNRLESFWSLWPPGIDRRPSKNQAIDRMRSLEYSSGLMSRMYSPINPEAANHFIINPTDSFPAPQLVMEVAVTHETIYASSRWCWIGFSHLVLTREPDLVLWSGRVGPLEGLNNCGRAKRLGKSFLAFTYQDGWDMSPQSVPIVASHTRDLSIPIPNPFVDIEVLNLVHPSQLLRNYPSQPPDRFRRDMRRKRLVYSFKSFVSMRRIGSGDVDWSVSFCWVSNVGHNFVGVF